MDSIYQVYTTFLDLTFFSSFMNFIGSYTLGYALNLLIWFYVIRPKKSDGSLDAGFIYKLSLTSWIGVVAGLICALSKAICVFVPEK